MAKKKNKRQSQKKNAGSVSSEKKLLDKARKICRESARYVHSLPPKSSRFADGLDFDETRTKRRISATLGIMDGVRALAEQLCPEAPEVYTFEDDWLHRNLMLIPGCDYYEARNYTLLAASLWILDQLRETGHFFDACREFPTDDRVYDDIDYPDIWDISHEEDSILGMLWTIQHRNDDCIGLPSPVTKKKKQDNWLPRYYLDQYTAENLHRQDVPSRRRFEQILSLISPEEIDRAVKQYEELFWDLIRRIYISRAIYVKEDQALAQRLEEYSLMHDEFVRDAKNLNLTPEGEIYPQAPIFATQNPFDMLRTPDRKAQNKARTDLMMRIGKLTSTQDQLDQDQDDLDLRISMLTDSVGQMLTFTKKTREHFFGPAVAKVWEDFRIPDPYILCFAHLYLVDQGSDLPWIYGVSGPLLELCASVLPWKYVDYEDDPEGVWEHWDEESQHYVFGHQKIELPKRIKAPVLEDWFAMDYVDKVDPGSEEPDATNLAQVMYEITGGILPRNLTRYENALEELDRYGISGKKALHPLMYCMTLLGEARHRTHVWHMPDQLAEKPVQTQPEQKVVTVESLQKQLQELQQENKQLRSALYDAGRDAKNAQKKLEATEIAVEADRQELADLRELVFNQQEDVYHEEPTETSVRFPYTAQQRIVVFGGHDSWAREIKPRLPGIRFIDRTMLPNADLIRRADTIWIQTNALSHAYFYKIIDEARKYRIPVRYFAYASALKCAEQLALEDMGE